MEDWCCILTKNILMVGAAVARTHHKFAFSIVLFLALFFILNNPKKPV